ncbi:unnamed protein product [Ranitomeya imitator]|uniref:Transposase n=1 Tax=Ranitomeya imitator TaxID=111125 RepID=A0ABN9MQS4_9NEOB|nr:unnamed protein product [Ranitomeya imitator]
MSPDLNPIEHLWRDLKMAVWRRHPSNIRDLEQFAKEEWSKIPAEHCKKLIDGYRKRPPALAIFTCPRSTEVRRSVFSVLCTDFIAPSDLSVTAEDAADRARRWNEDSEKCLKTYSVLLALAEAKQEIMLGQVSSGDILNSGWRLLPKDLEIQTKLFLMEVKKIFRREENRSELESKKMAGQTLNSPYAPWLSDEEEQMLKDYIQSLKWDLSSVTMSDHFIPGISHAEEVTQCAEEIKAKVDGAIKNSTDASSCLPEKPARAQIMQDLMYTKKKLLELKASLQLLQIEKRALELQCLTQQEQEKAYMLIRDHLQMEQNDWTKEGSGKYKADKQKSPDGERESLSQSKKSTSSPTMQRLLDSLKTSSEMKVRIEGLISEVDQLSSKVCADNVISAQMIKDFFKAHRNLFLTYQNACRKYHEQQHKLESQADLISQQQQRQLQKLWAKYPKSAKEKD